MNCDAKTVADFIVLGTIWDGNYDEDEDDEFGLDGELIGKALFKDKAKWVWY